MRNKLMWIPLLLLALAPSAQAEQIDRTVTIEPGTRIGLELIAGEVTIVGWDRSEVSITGSLDERYEELDVRQRGRSLDIEVDVKEGDHRRWSSGAKLEIRVPRRSNLELETVSAVLDISDVAGEINVETVSGDVTIDGDQVELSISSVSGRTRVRAATLLGVEFESVSGSAEFEGALADGDFSFELVTGSLTLRVPSGTSAEYDIETFSGRIENEFGPKAERTSEYLPSKMLHFSEGGGQASVSIESFQGTVRLSYL